MFEIGALAPCNVDRRDQSHRQNDGRQLEGHDVLIRGKEAHADAIGVFPEGRANGLRLSVQWFACHQPIGGLRNLPANPSDARADESEGT